MSVNIRAVIINSTKRTAKNVLITVDMAPISHHRVENVWDRVLMDNTLQCIQISALPVVHLDSISHFMEIDVLETVDTDSI